MLISLTPAQIREKIDILSQGRFVIYTRCKTPREQDETVRFIREKAPITAR